MNADELRHMLLTYDCLFLAYLGEHFQHHDIYLEFLKHARQHEALRWLHHYSRARPLPPVVK